MCISLVSLFVVVCVYYMCVVVYTFCMFSYSSFVVLSSHLLSTLLRHCVDLSPVLLYVRGAELVLRGYVLVRQ